MKVLDKGFCNIVSYYESDADIASAARVSYHNYGEVRTQEEDGKLLKYLWKNKHTSPFEMAEMKWHVKAPIFVARQWVRHRTANWNEVSGRYKEMEPEFYYPNPEVILKQSTTNKQGRGEQVPENVLGCHDTIKLQSEACYSSYKTLLSRGVARELARMVLPLNLYTEWVWKCDLRNILHFLSLRQDPHAQWEIRQYADVMAKGVAKHFPLTWEAYNNGKEK